MYGKSFEIPWFQTTDQYGYPYDKPEWINDKWRMDDQSMISGE
jgi:hypothetical protein